MKVVAVVVVERVRALGALSKEAGLKGHRRALKKRVMVI